MSYSWRKSNETSTINSPEEMGTYYETKVPDTLDLAELAKLGLNYFTEIMETSERHKCEMPFNGDFTKNSPPSMIFNMTGLSTCQCKALEAMAMERLMTGSHQNLGLEADMVEMMVSFLGEDGLYWCPGTPNKPWLGAGTAFIPEPFVMVHGQGRMLRAMIAWYQYTGDVTWKDRINRLIKGIDKIVVHKNDYAYFPVVGHYEGDYLRSCYTKQGWKDTVEPPSEKFGEEGSLFNHQGHTPGALANWHMLIGDTRALRLSGELVRFYMKPKFWADWKNGEYPDIVGSEHAHWQGHFHGYINVLRAILEYAIAANDAQLKSFVRDGYEWTRQSKLARIGYVGDGQGCACGRLIGLAIKLTDAGVGEYWEDVDQYIRNQGTEQQITPEDKKYLYSLSEGKSPPPSDPDIISDRVIERAIGGFAGNPSKKGFALCCGAHGNMGLFYAWEGTLRYKDGTVQINLLLNRASPYLDIDSYLPYEGKVVLKNKTAQEAFVRIPLWVDRKAVNCWIGKSKIPAKWFGNYLRFQGLTSGDILTIEFPMVEKIEQWTIGKTTHTCKFKGNTLVGISPQLPDSPMYKRRTMKYKVNKAPMKKVTRYVTSQVLLW